jgi:hypothetical protein
MFEHATRARAGSARSGAAKTKRDHAGGARSETPHARRKRNATTRAPAVHDLVDGEWRRGAVGVRGVVLGERLGDLATRERVIHAKARERASARVRERSIERASD